MSLTKTLTENRQVRLNPQYVMIAGVDDNDVPRFFKVSPGGSLSLTMGGVDLPIYDEILVEYYTTTNNMHFAIYNLAGTEVGRWTLTYVDGGAADNDKLASAAFTTP